MPGRPTAQRNPAGTDIVAEPAFAEALIQGVADYQVTLYEHVLAEVGPYVDVVMVAEDLGSQEGP